MAPRRLCYLPFGLPLEPHIFLVLSGTPYSDLIEPLETTCSLISRPQNVPVCSRLLLNIYIYIYFFFLKIFYLLFYSILFYSILFYSIWLRWVFIAVHRWAFSSCSEWGLLFFAMCGLLIAVASLIAEHRL